MTDNQSLIGRVAAITGGTGGIGKAICQRFLREGAAVYALDRAAAELDGVTFIEMDVTRPEQVTAAFARIEDQSEKLDILVNAAGIEIEKTIEDNEFNFMAMSSLASGYSKPINAYQYIGKFKKIESICVGVSSKKHVLDTFNAIKTYI